MIVLSMIAAAAVATQPLEPVAEADMRCVAALLFAVGTADERKDVKAVGVLIAGVAYFNGRLDARLPGIDYAGHFKRLASSPAFSEQMPTEIPRCAKEAGAAMQGLGRAAQSIGS